MNHPQYLTVRALTKYIKRKFDADPHLMNVLVKGEISNFKRHSSGHMYFTLKDEQSRLMAVMFAREAVSMKFVPENGMNVLIKGNISVYEMSGQYQIYVKEMQPDGIGELYLAYEQLKKKLESEGLFRPERKRKIPSFPETIGVITSPTGAAIKDIITTIKRRYPIGKILIIPALVQGNNASSSIADAIKKANIHSEPDVLIVGRGGGSIEELWAFNEEKVARAIDQSAIPVISAVGHETDITIADFVADVRAATPTAAAEIAVPHVEELMEHLLQRKTRLYQGISSIVRTGRSQLNYLEQSYVFRNPHKLYEQKWQQLDRLTENLHAVQRSLLKDKENIYIEMKNRLKLKHPANEVIAARKRCEMAKHRLIQGTRSVWRSKVSDFTGKTATLEALSPLNILRRGFNIAHTEDGAVLKSVEQTKPGEKLTLRLADGKLKCTINQMEKGAQDGRESNI